jgi:phage terminase large subunit
MATIQIPYNFNPRPYQIEPFNALSLGYKRVAFCMHRRAGKDLICINALALHSMKRKGTYLYMLPYYKQARLVVWEAIRNDGFRVIDHFHPALVARKENQQMVIELSTGSFIRFVGSDNIDSIVGTNPVGVVFSEFSLHKPSAYNYLRPILVENNGWAIFQGTPRGKNTFWKLSRFAKSNPKWFWRSYDITQTMRHNGKPIITLDDIEEERQTGMPEELIQQEYFCSWDAGLVGSYFGDLMKAAAIHGRIRFVPYDPKMKVFTAWDLGRDDTNVIIFAQYTGREIHIIQVYANTNKGGDHYAKYIHEQPYVYDTHFFPHDVEVHEYMTNATRRETFEDLGIEPIVTIPRMGWTGDGLKENHHIIRQMLPITYFHNGEDVEDLIEGLKSYRREWDEKNNCFKETYVHDWSSHYARAFNALAMGLQVHGSSTMSVHIQERAQMNYNELDLMMHPEIYTQPNIQGGFNPLNDYQGGVSGW